MATLASDTLINGSNVDIATGYNGNWTYGLGSSGNIDVGTSGAFPTSALGSGSLAFVYYSGISWSSSADQWAQVTLNTAPNASIQVGLCLRAAANTCYIFYGETSFYDVRKYNFGGASLIGGAKSWTMSNGDILYFSVQGTTLIAKQNNTVLQTVTDATFSSGSPGIAMLGGGATGPSIDNWFGGNFVSNEYLLYPRKYVPYYA